MLARDAERIRERCRADRAPACATMQRHAALLQRLREAERRRRLVQRVEESRRERRGGSTRSRSASSSTPSTSTSANSSAAHARDGGSIGAAQRREREEREARELARQLRGPPRLIAAARRRRRSPRPRASLRNAALELRGRASKDAVARDAAESAARAAVARSPLAACAKTTMQAWPPRRPTGSDGLGTRAAQFAGATVGRDQLVRTAQDVARVRIRDSWARVLERLPPARGDALRRCGGCRRLLRLHQEEVTDLVDQAGPGTGSTSRSSRCGRATRQIVDAGLLAHLAQRGGLGRARRSRGVPSGIPSCRSCRG